MKGWLIVNEFLQSQKFTELNMKFLESAKKFHIDLIIKTNAEILVDIDTGNNYSDKYLNTQFNDRENAPDFVLFWDKDIRLASYLEKKGYPVFNSSRGIEICDDKSLMHLKLMDSGIPMPRTIIAPMTYLNIRYSNMKFLDKVIKTLGFPLILKESFGSFGQQVYIIHNKSELEEKVMSLSGKSMLFQEYIKSSKGRDIRLQVVGNRVVAGMYRYNDQGDFRANLTNGGKMKAYIPTKEESELAVLACQKLEINFAGVDILFGKNNEPILCEVNSNAHFTNLSNITGINVSDSIMEYIYRLV